MRGRIQQVLFLGSGRVGVPRCVFLTYRERSRNRRRAWMDTIARIFMKVLLFMEIKRFILLLDIVVCVMNSDFVHTALIEIPWFQFS